MTIIWRFNTIFAAIADFFIFGQKLKYYHILGLVGMTACTVLLGVDKASEQKSAKNGLQPLPLWMPLLTGFMVPVSMAANAMLNKHLNSPRVGFNPSKLTFTTIGFQNVIILAIGAILWSNGTLIFDREKFYVGMLSSCILSIGIVSIQNAL